MTDLQTLFATDPLKLSEADLEALIADYRGRRAQFALENNKKAGSIKSTVTKTEAAKASKLGGIALDLSLLDLPK